MQNTYFVHSVPAMSVYRVGLTFGRARGQRSLQRPLPEKAPESKIFCVSSKVLCILRCVYASVKCIEKICSLSLSDHAE